MPENTHVRLGVESAEISAASGLPPTPASHGTQSGSPANRQWRVLLVDDNAAVRTALKMLLEEHADLQVVGEASDGEESVVLAERYRPDVTLMDIRLPHVSGVEATRQINNKLSQSMIIGMSSLYTPHSVRPQRRRRGGVIQDPRVCTVYLLSKSTPLGLHDRLNGGVEREIGCREYP